MTYSRQNVSKMWTEMEIEDHDGLNEVFERHFNLVEASTKNICHFVHFRLWTLHLSMSFITLISIYSSKVSFSFVLFCFVVLLHKQNACSTEYAKTIDKAMVCRAYNATCAKALPNKSTTVQHDNGSLFADTHRTDHRMHIIDFLILSRFVCSSI